MELTNDSGKTITTKRFGKPVLPSSAQQCSCIHKNQSVCVHRYIAGRGLCPLCSIKIQHNNLKDSFLMQGAIRCSCSVRRTRTVLLARLQNSNHEERTKSTCGHAECVRREKIWIPKQLFLYSTRLCVVAMMCTL